MSQFRTRNPTDPNREITGFTRFTAYLSSRERELLTQAAKEQRTSLNFVVRIAIRQYLGIDDD